ncbi:MAG TPA: GH25 family lysozyme [Gaiellaceae bacterium]|nr:GH25 family lysozyme [Gaiellaceae bacterium]
MGVTIEGSRRPRRALLVLLATAAAGLHAPAGAGAQSYAKGLDVSHYQGSIDWIQVAGGGYSFTFAKATEGTTLIDPTYAINRAGSDSLGLRIGAYHFARPGGSGAGGIAANAIAQADFFVGTAQPAAGDLPPVLDLETKGSLGTTGLVQWTQAWLDEVYARTGIDAAVYVSPSFWKTALGDTTTVAGDGHPLWIAHWTTNAVPTVPAMNWAGLGWTFWQWTDCAQVPGIAHCVDGDRLNGTDPSSVTIPPYPTGVPVVSTAPAVVGTAQAGAKLAGIPGVWSGGKPVTFTYQWQSCDAAGLTCAPIPGATLETYTPTATDVGHALVLTVTAASNEGPAVASSPPTLAIAPAGSSASARPAVTVAPLVTGTTQVGQTLTASPGTWTGSPTSFAYTWRRCDATGANCASIAGATASTYTLTPGDIGTTVSLVVTATGAGGAGIATAPTTAVIAAATVPQAVVGSAASQAGAAGAVIAADGRATVTWQPGSVPVAATVSLTPADGGLSLAGTGVALDVQPAAGQLPWPVDLAYAAAPPGQVVGFSSDGTVWSPVATLTGPTLPDGLDAGAYTDGTVLHVLTRTAGRFALFRPGAWGDPSRVSTRQPVLARVAPITVRRQSGRTILLVTRLSVSSQSDLFANAFGPQGLRPSLLPRGSRLALPLRGAAAKTEHTRILSPGGFPVQLRIDGRRLPAGSVASVRVTAIDPWGRRASFVLGFRAP